MLGLCMSAVLLYPTLLALSDFPRANLPFGKDYGLWFFSASKRYAEVFRGMIMPPEIPGDLNFYHKAGSSWIPNWTSTSAYLPLFSVAGVWAYLKTKRYKKNWLSILIIFCFVISFVPLLNNIWLLFKSNYYTRWWYMPILLMSLATAIALDDRRTNWRGGIRATIIAGAAISLPIGLTGLLYPLINPSSIENTTISDLFGGLENYTDRFWLYVFFFALSMAVLVLLIKVMRPIYFSHELPKVLPVDEPSPEAAEEAEEKPKPKIGFIQKWSSKDRFGISVLAVTCAFAFLVGTFYEQMCYYKAFDPDVYSENYLSAAETIDLEGLQESRLENFDGVRNLSIFMHTPGASSFHSVVPTSTVEFYESMGIDRDVATAIPLDRGALRSLLSIRYVLDDDKDRDKFSDLEWLSYYGEKGIFDVWENEAFIPMGFCYDYAIYRTDYNMLNDSSKSNIMLAALVVEDEDIEKFEDVLEFAPYITLDYSDSAQIKNAADRAATASTSVEFGNDSFTSTITLQRENYIFYSIPWDEGWTAYVDGVETEICRVNVGFMAVKASAGEHEVVFEYVSPGFNEGLCVTLISGGLFAVYIAVCVICKCVSRRRKSVSAD